jgi:hypothetical protein
MNAGISTRRSSGVDSFCRRVSVQAMEDAMKRQILAVTVFGLLVAVGAIACDKGPMQRTGAKLDRATDQDKLIGKGPIEKAGKSIDEALKK